MAVGAEYSSRVERVLPQRLRDLLAGRDRKRLARAVREHAQAEHKHRVRAGEVELAAIRARTALYERIALGLEDLDRPAVEEGLALLRRLLAERLPLCDFGPFARARDARIESVLSDLEREQK